MKAAARGHPDVVASLIKRGADLEVKDAVSILWMTGYCGFS